MPIVPQPNASGVVRNLGFSFNFSNAFATTAQAQGVPVNTSFATLQASLGASADLYPVQQTAWGRANQGYILAGQAYNVGNSADSSFTTLTTANAIGQVGTSTDTPSITTSLWAYAKNAQLTADTAFGTASTANTNANTANANLTVLTTPSGVGQVGTSTDAPSLTTSLWAYANNAQTTATSAQTTAASAQTTANTAITNASIAQTTANTAQTTATSAQTSADNAQATATSAQTTANTAITNASTAQTSADNAQATATSAQTTANTAQTTATSAQTTADNAQATATSAQTTADNAQTTADTANTTADTANTTANTANTTANTALASFTTLTTANAVGKVGTSTDTPFQNTSLWALANLTFNRIPYQDYNELASTSLPLAIGSNTLGTQIVSETITNTIATAGVMITATFGVNCLNNNETSTLFYWISRGSSPAQTERKQVFHSALANDARQLSCMWYDTNSTAGDKTYRLNAYCLEGTGRLTIINANIFIISQMALA